MNKEYKEGEKSKGVCEKCSGVVDTTFVRRDYIFEGKTIKNVLQSVCDKCDTTIAIPHQEMKRVFKNESI